MVDCGALNQQCSIPREKKYIILTTKIIILLLHQFLYDTPINPRPGRSDGGIAAVHSDGVMQANRMVRLANIWPNVCSRALREL